ncbi:translation initiation factor [bacterium]|nr:translation initiation factor [bacterium]
MKHLFQGTKWDVPCERCGVVLSKCQCPPPPEPAPAEKKALEPGAQCARIRVEKRPRGKKVTLVEGLSAKDLDALAPRLKALCGAGGTVKDGRLEVQGEHREKIEGELSRAGYKTRRQ